MRMEVERDMAIELPDQICGPSSGWIHVCHSKGRAIMCCDGGTERGAVLGSGE
jgi:hypothetical protein